MNPIDVITEALEANRLDAAIRAGLRHHRRHQRAQRLHPACRLCPPQRGPLPPPPPEGPGSVLVGHDGTHTLLSPILGSSTLLRAS